MLREWERELSNLAPKTVAKWLLTELLEVSGATNTGASWHVGLVMNDPAWIEIELGPGLGSLRVDLCHLPTPDRDAIGEPIS